MNRKRVLAIIGIVLAFVAIGLLDSMESTLYSRVRDEYSNRDPNIVNNSLYRSVEREVAADTVFDEISYAIGICGLFLYPIFHYTVSLREGIRIKKKKAFLFTIGFSVLGFCVLVFLIDLNFPVYQFYPFGFETLLSCLYVSIYLAFATYMLVRSFIKDEPEA